MSPSKPLSPLRPHAAAGAGAQQAAGRAVPPSCLSISTGHCSPQGLLPSHPVEWTARSELMRCPGEPGPANTPRRLPRPAVPTSPRCFQPSATSTPLANHSPGALAHRSAQEAVPGPPQRVPHCGSQDMRPQAWGSLLLSPHTGGSTPPGRAYRSAVAG